MTDFEHYTPNLFPRIKKITDWFMDRLVLPPMGNGAIELIDSIEVPDEVERYDD